MFCNQLHTYFYYKRKQIYCYKTKISLQHILTKFWQPIQPWSNFTVSNLIEIEKNIAQFHEFIANLPHIKAR